MDDFDDPLDLDGDGEVGAFEMSILDEESSKNRGGSGCCLVFLLLGSAITVAGWGVQRIL